LTKIIDIKKTEDGIEVSDLITDYKKLPDDEKYYQKLKKYVLSKDMYVGSFVTEDGKVASIMAKIYDKPNINKMIVAKEISDLVAKEFISNASNSAVLPTLFAPTIKFTFLKFLICKLSKHLKFLISIHSIIYHNLIKFSKILSPLL
jgi:hypothetical protein